MLKICMLSCVNGHFVHCVYVVCVLVCVSVFKGKLRWAVVGVNTDFVAYSTKCWCFCASPPSPPSLVSLLLLTDLYVCIEALRTIWFRISSVFMVKWIEIVSGFWPDTNTGRKFNRFFAPGMRSNALPCFMAKINFPPESWQQTNRNRTQAMKKR